MAFEFQGVLDALLEAHLHTLMELDLLWFRFRQILNRARILRRIGLHIDFGRRLLILSFNGLRFPVLKVRRCKAGLMIRHQGLHPLDYLLMHGAGLRVGADLIHCQRLFKTDKLVFNFLGHQSLDFLNCIEGLIFWSLYCLRHFWVLLLTKYDVIRTLSFGQGNRLGQFAVVEAQLKDFSIK